MPTRDEIRILYAAADGHSAVSSTRADPRPAVSAANGAGAAASTAPPANGAAGATGAPAGGASEPQARRGAAGRVSAIVLAGGSGSRFTGSFIPKQFVQVRGKPILAYVLETYQQLALVDDVTLVINRRYEQLYYDIVDTYGCFKVRRLVPGGATRQASSAAGLAAIEPCEIVVVQDGVRPFTSPRVIMESIEVARQVGGANVVVRTLDTIVESRDGFISSIPDRTYLYSGQAPQAFRYEQLLEAHRHAAASGVTSATDDAQLVLAAGGRVGVVEGSYTNFKITTYEDFLFASTIVDHQRTGNEDRW
jgi:2-C-methyl-D-erythritol 4-phosphate cytidylyltransferase